MHRWCLLNLTVQGFSLNLTVRGGYLISIAYSLFSLNMFLNNLYVCAFIVMKIIAKITV